MEEEVTSMGWVSHGRGCMVPYTPTSIVARLVYVDPRWLGDLESWPRDPLNQNKYYCV